MESVWSGQQGASSLMILDQVALVSAMERSAVVKQSANGRSFRSHSNCLSKWKKRVEHFQPRETQNSKSEMQETEVKKADRVGVKGATASSSQL